LLEKPAEEDEFAPRPPDFAERLEQLRDGFSEILSGDKPAGAFFFPAEFPRSRGFPHLLPDEGSHRSGVGASGSLSPGGRRGALVELPDGGSAAREPGDAVTFPAAMRTISAAGKAPRRLSRIADQYQDRRAGMEALCVRAAAGSYGSCAAVA
jgi:hypothetical protein